MPTSFAQSEIEYDHEGYRVPPLVSIVSPGELGCGLAIMLRNHRYMVGTNVKGRSPDTVRRAKDAGMHCYPTDEDMFAESAYILSIVPPSDAMTVAQRVATAAVNYTAQEGKTDKDKNPAPLYFLELNAISPTTARNIAVLFTAVNLQLQSSPYGRRIVFIDGSILGGPPTLNPQNGVWTVPRIVLSGPEFLSMTAFNEFTSTDDASTLVDEEEDDGEMFEKLLKIKWVGREIGQASGLKMCFASLTKGLTALAIQSFTTAASLNLSKPLQDELAHLAPNIHSFVNRSLTRMPPKAYRWVGEMEEIAETFSSQVGFEKDVFMGAAEVYRVICGETILGQERTEKRSRGQTIDDITALMLDGMKARQQAKKESEDAGEETGLESGVIGLKVGDGKPESAGDQKKAA